MKKRGIENMAKTKIEFIINAPEGLNLSIVGSSQELGNWNDKSSVELKYCSDCQKYKIAKMLEVGSSHEFKVIANKSWENVEKGTYGEDVANHAFIANKGTKVEINIPRF